MRALLVTALVASLAACAGPAPEDAGGEDEQGGAGGSADDEFSRGAGGTAGGGQGGEPAPSGEQSGAPMGGAAGMMAASGEGGRGGLANQAGIPSEPGYQRPNCGSKDPVFQPNAQNHIVVEAESATVIPPWQLQDEQLDYFGSPFEGSGYLRFTGNSEGGGAPNGIITYKIQINQPGTYVLLPRAIAKADNGEGDHANDMYVRIDGAPGSGGQFNKIYISGNRATWSTGTLREPNHGHKEAVNFKLDRVGVWEFQIAGRSKNYILDRWILFTGSSFGLNQLAPETGHICK